MEIRIYTEDLKDATYPPHLFHSVEDRNNQNRADRTKESKGSASYTGRKSAAIQIEAVGNNRSFSRTSRALAQDNRMMQWQKGD